MFVTKKGIVPLNKLKARNEPLARTEVKNERNY